MVKIINHVIIIKLHDFHLPFLKGYNYRSVNLKRKRKWWFVDQHWMVQGLSPAWKQPQEEGLTRADYEGQSSGLHNCLNCQTSLTIKANCAPKYINAEAVHLRVRTKVTSMYKPANSMYLHTLIYKNVQMVKKKVMWTTMNVVRHW